MAGIEAPMAMESGTLEVVSWGRENIQGSIYSHAVSSILEAIDVLGHGPGDRCGVQRLDFATAPLHPSKYEAAKQVSDPTLTTWLPKGSKRTSRLFLVIVSIIT